MQKAILKRYWQVRGDLTLKQISKDTGIQLTRVFRILRGAEMKLSEYEIFQKIIEKHDDYFSSEMKLTASLCENSLSPKCIDDLLDLMKRKLLMKKIIDDDMDYGHDLRVAA